VLAHLIDLRDRGLVIALGDVLSDDWRIL